MKVVICGGGNLGHAIAGKLSLNNNLEVMVLTDRASAWESRLKIIENDGFVQESGSIKVVSIAKENIEDADIILLTVPGYMQRSVLNNIAPFVDRKRVWVGSVQCFSGFFFMANEILGNDCNLFGFQRVPFIARVSDYGASVYIKGYKKELHIAYISKNNDVGELIRWFEHFFQIPVILLKSYLDATLTNSNPLLHPARIYSVLKNYQDGMTFERQPFFYEEWDDASSEILIKCDEELQLLSGRLGDFMNSVTKITAYYGVKDQFELTNKLKHIEAFKGIKFPMVKTPIGFKPDFSSRYFTEDIPYGLLVIKSIGEKVGMEMPEIDKIIRWYEKVMNKSYFKNGLLMGEDVADTGAIQDSDVFKSILRY